MTPTIILSIIDSSLKIFLATLEAAPPDQKAALLARHNERMEKWEKILNTLKFWED